MGLYVRAKLLVHGLKAVLSMAGFVVLVIWVSVMAFSATSFFLNYWVPEILASPEFMVGGCGFSFLYNSLMFGARGARARQKLELIPSILGLIMGVTLLSLGAFVILFRTPNFFTYVCLIIGTALIFISTKQILDALKVAVENLGGEQCAPHTF